MESLSRWLRKEHVKKSRCVLKLSLNRNERSIDQSVFAVLDRVTVASQLRIKVCSQRRGNPNQRMVIGLQKSRLLKKVFAVRLQKKGIAVGLLKRIVPKARDGKAGLSLLSHKALKGHPSKNHLKIKLRRTRISKVYFLSNLAAT